jgi:hypothetical protein
MGEDRTWAIYVCSAPGCNLPESDQYACPRVGCPRVRKPGSYSDAVEVVEESRLRETEAERDRLSQALKPFADAYERGVAGDNIWPVSDQRYYRNAYHARAGIRARGVLENGAQQADEG